MGFHLTCIFVGDGSGLGLESCHLVLSLRLLIVPAKVDIRVRSVLRVIHADSDRVLGHINPRIRQSSTSCRGAQRRPVRNRRVRRRKRLVTLQHHVQQRLNVHNLMLKRDPDAARYTARQLLQISAIRVAVDLLQARADAALVFGNVLDAGPLVGDLGVVVALLRVVDIGVDAALKDGPVARRLGRGLARHFRQLDVEERRDVAQVEDAGVTQLDGLLLQLLVREHALGDNVPRLPERGPVLESGEDAAVL